MNLQGISLIRCLKNLFMTKNIMAYYIQAKNIIVIKKKN